MSAMSAPPMCNARRRMADLPPDHAILNIASGHAVKIGTILDMLLTRATCRITIRQDPARLRPVEIPTALGDASQAMRLLHWQPQIPLSETLDRVLAEARQKIQAV